jgi:mycoredoxin
MIRQIEEQAGYYPFGDCQQLVIVPIRYSGSGAVLELGIHEWNGAGLSQVYFNDGVHGTWSKAGDNIIFEESLYLYGEPNCCPCNRQTLQHTWDGEAFVQTGSAITPTYSGTPPPMCVPWGRDTQPMPAPIILYGHAYWPQVYSVRFALDRAGVKYEYVNIRQDEAARARVRAINAGCESVPTLVFPDGTSLTEPSKEELEQRLASLGPQAE